MEKVIFLEKGTTLLLIGRHFLKVDAFPEVFLFCCMIHAELGYM